MILMYEVSGHRLRRRSRQSQSTESPSFIDYLPCYELGL
jgi:hypothetical protein